MKRTFGNRLENIMKKQRITAKELALKAGISATWISYLVNDKRQASDIVAEKLADALEVPVGHLTGEAASVIINERLEDIGMTLEEVAQKANVSLTWLKNLDDFIPGEDDLVESHELDWDSSIGDYKSYEWITRVAEVIGLPANQLRAALARQEIPVYDGPISSSPEEDFEFITPEQAFGEPGFTLTPISSPTKIIRIPVLGSIPAGAPVEAVENTIGWEDIPEEWTSGGRQYFGLLVRGDSMFPEYLEGDIVIIRKQPCCDSGDDCAVIINGADATLKRVRLIEDGIELEAVNPMYGRKSYTKQEVESLPVTILGVVVELRRKKK